LPLSRAHVSEAEEQRGYSLACRTYPLSDIEVEVKGQYRQRPSGRLRSALSIGDKQHQEKSRVMSVMRIGHVNL